jgi:hypothetical protein
MATAKKETIYIEADDEITTVIEKVVTAKNTIIALVLPKRATVFQSIVNLKLLKKAASEAKRKVVLISSDSGLESIASIAGVYVAKSLTSKPFIPKRATKLSLATVGATELESAHSATIESKPEKTSYESRVTAEVNEDEQNITDDDDSLEIDNTQTDSNEAEVVVIPDEKKKKFKIPDFGSFSLRLALVGFIVLLLGAGWYFGFKVMPKATITINADTSNSQVSFPFTVDTSAKSVDESKSILPAIKEEITKENKVTVEATGQKDIGEKATGTITMTARICGSIATPKTVPSGTGVSAGSVNFVTENEVSFTLNSLSGSCLVFSANQDADIVAVASGESSNVPSGTAFTISGRSDISASGETSGGTSNIVKIVAEADIQKAKEQLQGVAKADASNELKERLSSQQKYPLLETVNESEPVFRTSKEVNAEATEVTVTQTVTYSLLGVSANELAQLLEGKINESFTDGQARNIRDNGLEKATYSITQKTSNEIQTLNLQTVATIGPSFDQEAIKKEVAGKKRGDIEKLLESREGVRSVSVEYSPLWITTTTKNPQKIIIAINEVQN